MNLKSCLVASLILIVFSTPFTVVGVIHCVTGRQINLFGVAPEPLAMPVIPKVQCDCEEGISRFTVPDTNMRLLENGNYEFYIEGERVEAPPGSMIEIERRQSSTVIGDRYTDTRTGNSVGASLATTDASATKEFEHNAADLDLANMFVKGGSTSFISKVNINNSRFLWILGGIAILVGCGLAIWAQRIKLGVSLIVGGVLLIIFGFLIDNHPWLLVLAGLGLIAYFGYYVVDMRKGKLYDDALAAVTRSTKEIELADTVVEDWFKGFKDNLRPNIQANTPGDQPAINTRQSVLQAIDDAYTKTQKQTSLAENIFQYVKDRVKNHADRMTKEVIEKSSPKS